MSRVLRSSLSFWLACLLEEALVLVAALIARPTGRPLLADLHWSVADLAVGVSASAPLCVLFWYLVRSPAAPLATSQETDLYVVDEIGKMECFSRRFASAMRDLLASERRVLATAALHGAGLVAEAKHHPDAQVWRIDTESRDAVVDRILGWVGHR